MARKGNQRKNGLDQSASNFKKGVSSPGTAPLSTTDEASASDEKVVSHDIPSASHPITSTEGVSDMDRRKDGKKSKKSSRKSQRIDRKVTANHVTDQAMSDDDAEEGKTSIPSVEASNMSNGGNMAPESVHNPDNKSDFGDLPTGLDKDDGLRNVESAEAAVYKYVRLFAFFVARTSVEWIERHKPTFVTIKTYVQKTLDQVSLKIQQGKPIVSRWMKHLGNILLLLFMVWLDCTLRGIDSFLRMGSTSFFSIVWCTILSIISMVGIWKFLLSLSVAAVIGLFLGITLAFALTAFAAATVLWFYGSFWTTGIIISLGGFSFIMGHIRFALFVISCYSIYCAWSYVGFLGLVLGLNLSFISSDALLYFFKNVVDEDRKKSDSNAQTAQGQAQSSFCNTESAHRPSDETGAAEHSSGVLSSSGSEFEMTSEDEIFRLLNCKDHYGAFGLSRFQAIDASVIKKEYRRKAMLVHPDKNMGNEKAAEAFKKLQNAYEILSDSFKLKAYDDELRTEELVNLFRKSQNASTENKRFNSRHARTEAGAEELLEESRRIACKKCGFFHIWMYTKRPKSKARWCQECQDFHQAKDGDGWVEQSSRPFLFGLLQQVEALSAYVCAEGKVYDVTEWYICQGMRCVVNAHKATFQVNTNVLSSKNGGGYHTKGNDHNNNNHNTEQQQQQPMNDEEFYEWFQNAVRSGMFDGGAHTSEKGGSSSSSAKRKKKGKKQR